MSAILQDYISALNGGNYTNTNSHFDLLNNSYVDFMLKPRPPAIGEEKELDCDMSEKSTKSCTTSKQTSSSNADSNSACLTPRKSKLSSRVSVDSSNNNKSIVAPLGFEPEGCTSKRENFNETNQSEVHVTSYLIVVPALKWGLSLNNLLNDGEGVRLYREFLTQERSSNILDFWFACQGLKLVPANELFMLTSLVRLIYRKYIRKEPLGLKNETKRKIVERLRSNVVDANIFEKAQAEITEIMLDDSYPNFLKSNLYLDYIRLCLDKSQKSVGNSSGSTESSGSDPSASTKSFLNPLPTLHEDDIVSSKDKNFNNTYSLQKDKKELWNGLINNCKMKNENRFSHPFSTHFDSEIQSLSSDTYTDGYLSQNENINQVERVHRHAPAKRMKRVTTSNSNQNHNNQNEQCSMILNKVPIERDLAEKNPAKFAEILITKLEKIQEEEIFLAKLKSAVLSSNQLSSQNFLESTPIKYQPTCHPHIQSHSYFPHLSKYTGSEAAANVEEDNGAQSILEQHVSRIWKDDEALTAAEEEHSYPSKIDITLHCSRHSNIPTRYNIYSNDERLSRTNCASMNSLNNDYYNHRNDDYNQFNNYDVKYFSDYNDSSVWPSSMNAKYNDSRTGNYVRLINPPLAYQYANNSTQNLSKNDVSMYRSDSHLKSSVDNRTKGQKRKKYRLRLCVDPTALRSWIVH